MSTHFKPSFAHSNLFNEVSILAEDFKGIVHVIQDKVPLGTSPDAIAFICAVVDFKNIVNSIGTWQTTQWKFEHSAFAPHINKLEAKRFLHQAMLCVHDGISRQIPKTNVVVQDDLIQWPLVTQLAQTTENLYENIDCYARLRLAADGTLRKENSDALSMCERIYAAWSSWLQEGCELSISDQISIA